MSDDALTSGHSEIGASSYHRWRECPGSVKLSRGIEKLESEYAREGTIAHDVAAKILSGDLPPEKYIDDAIKTYVAYIRGLLKADARVWHRIEQRFNLSNYYPGLFGTADAVIYYPSFKKLIVVDYKHGQGVPVEVEENVQLMYYGLGAMHALNKPVNDLELVIVQPRCFHKDGPIRSWKTTALRMFDFVADLVEDAKKTTWPNAELKPGDHCRWCPAQAAHCPAIKNKALVMAQDVFSTVKHYDPIKLAETLDMLPAIENYVKSVREFAYRESELGRTIPGYKLVPKRATRKWVENMDPSKLAREFGLKEPEVVDYKLKSPAQIEKMVPKNLVDKVDLFTTAESSGHNLVKEKDDRAAVLTGPKEVFDIVE